MQNWTTEMWQVAGIGLVVGFVLAYFLISFTKGSVKRYTATESELKKAKAELAAQKQYLEQHFSQSAELFKTLAQDYKNLYNHLAQSSEQLLPESGKGLFLQNFDNAEKEEKAAEPEKAEEKAEEAQVADVADVEEVKTETPAENAQPKAEDEQPKDYKEGSSGILKK